MTEITFFNNPLSKWLVSIGIMVAVIILAKSIRWIFRNIIPKLTGKTKTSIDDALIEKIEKPLVYAIIIFGFWLALKRLIFSDEIVQHINDAYEILIIINATWLVSSVITGIIRESIQRSIEKNGSNKFDNSVIQTLNKVVSSFIWIFGIIIALGHVGVNIGALITGLGIGGVAFALASQDTIKNIFAGVVIFLDRPFRIGEQVKINGYDGVVEDIGMRSVRIRTSDKRLITMSCSKVADSIIENISSEPARRVVLLLGLTYDTTPEKMQIALDLLKKMPGIVPEIKHNTSALFNNYGDFALHITFTYFIRKNADINETQSNVNLKILSLFNENGLNFAFPTNTVIIDNK